MASKFEAAILATLRASGQPISIDELCEKVVASKTTVLTAARRLADQGIISGYQEEIKVPKMQWTFKWLAVDQPTFDPATEGV